MRKMILAASVALFAVSGFAQDSESRFVTFQAVIIEAEQLEPTEQEYSVALASVEVRRCQILPAWTEISTKSPSVLIKVCANYLAAAPRIAFEHTALHELCHVRLRHLLSKADQ